MLGRIVEVSNDKRHLSVYRGFMLVHSTGEDRQEVGRVPLDDMAALIANAHGLSYTNNLLVALAERGAPFVLCAANHNVVGMLWSMDGHHQQADGVNALLNYGYTVLRAATARSVVAAGLHPSIGLHHSHDNNAMRLVDDLMEPFRPVIDFTVWHLQRSGPCVVNADTKRALVKSLYQDLPTQEGKTPVLVAVQSLATSLAQMLLKERNALVLPLSAVPLKTAIDVDE